MCLEIKTAVHFSFILILGLILIGFSACDKSLKPVPPKAKIVPKNLTLFDDARVDNYFWLKERENPDVIAYLQAENTYMEAIMSHTKPLQEKLYKEMLSRIKETDLTVPEKIGDYYYYTRTQEGDQYKIYCRKKYSLYAEEEILLNKNELASGYDFLEIGVFEISPDHNLLAFSIDTSGSETYTIYIKDLQTGELLKDKIEDTYYSVEWANDNKTFFYTTLDEAKRPYKLFKHKLGGFQESDELIHHEKDEMYFVNLGKTKNKNFIILTLGSMITTEVHYLNANKPDTSFKLIHPRTQGMEYYIENHDNYFLIRTNDNAINFKLMKTPLSNPDKSNWKTVIEASEKVKLDKIEVFKNHLVIYQRANGLKQIRIQNLSTHQEHFVEFPEPLYTYWKGDNPEFNTTTLRYSYSSLITPKTVFDYDMNSKNSELKKQEEVLGGYKPGDYQSERIFAIAADGVKVSISLVYKKGIKKDGNNPLFMYGYGSYGSSRDPSFSSNRLSLLDRGFIYAIAHVRGSGIMGRQWYENGKLLNKKNTFTDFIACAEYLIKQKYTTSDHLVIRGGSAGGLLMGAVINMRPDLFKAVIAHVPFVDVITTMLDESIPLTAIEWEEWGDPHQKEDYIYMKSYSPYDNVTARDYPNLLITAGLNDPRVQYWEPAKWVAKLRTYKTDNNVLIFKTNMGAGHSGASGRYNYLKEIAFDYAFVFDMLGIRE